MGPVPTRHVLTVALCALQVSQAGAQGVVRGPYLQSPTHEGITVMWRTNIATGTSLWYGTQPDQLTLYANNAGNATDHSVRIEGLDPATTYYYAVGAGTTVLAGADQQHRFRTHPVPGTDEPLRIWATGDFGKGNAGQIAVKNSLTAFPGGGDTDLWIWLGDNAYDNGTDGDYQGKVFGLAGFSDIFNWLPFYPAPGNHDYNEVWDESTFFGIPYSNIDLDDHEGPYYDIVDVPELGEAGGRPSGLEVFYSFDLGNAHFISLNSEVYDFLNTSDGIDRMVDWLELDLMENDKRFTIAYFHQPPYSKGSHDSDDFIEFVMKAMRERVVPMLEHFDVDLVVCGHSHVYERSHLIHGHYGNSGSFNAATMLRDGNGGNFDAGTPYIKDTLSVTPDGTVYVVCGNGGSSESGASLDHPVMAVVHDGGCGSFFIDINGNRLDGTYLQADGTVGDSFTIVKGEAHVGITEQQTAAGLSVFPNPAEDLLNVWVQGPHGEGVLRLLDATGREVLSQRVASQRSTLDLRGIARGTYQLVLLTPEDASTVRVVLQ